MKQLCSSCSIRGDADSGNQQNLTRRADIGLLILFCYSGLMLEIIFIFDFFIILSVGPQIAKITGCQTFALNDPLIIKLHDWCGSTDISQCQAG